MAKEWQDSKKWNPFNSAKLMAHVDRWADIRPSADVPPPVLVTVDPTNKCNLNCKWCNAAVVRNSGHEMAGETLIQIAEFLPEWKVGPWGVKAVCIAGGGEPMLHPDFADFCDTLMRNNIRYGVVTNGTRIDMHQDALMWADWVGVSIDAGRAATYKALKGADMLDGVLEQCQALIRFAANTQRPLAKPGLGNGVFWKFLVHPQNIGDMREAAKTAALLGFKGIHFRPVSPAWNEQDNKAQVAKMTFTRRDIKTFNNNLAAIQQSYDGPDFSVYGVTHKMTNDFKPKHDFDLCRAVLMTAVFMPPTQEGDGCNIGVCCDRRGDLRTMTLNVPQPDWLAKWWGSERHWNMADAICPQKDCPRCTYAPHNAIFESVVERDDMTHDFI